MFRVHGFGDYKRQRQAAPGDISPGMDQTGLYSWDDLSNSLNAQPWLAPEADREDLDPPSYTQILQALVGVARLLQQKEGKEAVEELRVIGYDAEELGDETLGQLSQSVQQQIELVLSGTGYPEEVQRILNDLIGYVQQRVYEEG